MLKVKSTHFGFIEASGAAGMLIASLYFATRPEVKAPLRFSKISLLLLAGSLALAIIPLVTNFFLYRDCKFLPNHLLYFCHFLKWG
ncbi:hypothetical protein OL548_17495 [Lysinibacillus sp. MHQ-1]|nr:hypothetical protein OL548_17495 [Lysinibacillus sp. MHQ-1]